MRSCFIFLFLLICQQNYGQARSNKERGERNEQLTQLSALIKESEKLDEQKLIRIDELYQNFQRTGQSSQFEFCLNLYDEYSLFRGDSAFAYANRLLSIAKSSGNPSLISYARIKVGYTLVSSGMLKEAIDSLRTVNVNYLNAEQIAEYYAVMARYYYDLADYTQNDFYRLIYNNNGGKYIDSALTVYHNNSFEFNYYSGLKNLRLLDLHEASIYLKGLLNRPALTDHQFALTASTLSDIYIRNGQPDSAISLLTSAAMADIRSSTKETSALFSLSTLLFQKGDIENATFFIEKASNDAHFYGSRRRKEQLSVILPLIKEEQLRTLEIEKKNLFTYATIISFSFIALTALTTIIVRQVKKLQIQQKEIGKKNKALEQLVDEKEWLLKEIHHRVKNNLQTVVSLLESQSSYLENDALMAVQSSQHRVYAMSLIHQKLYRTESPETISMSAYLPELINYLSDSFNIRQRIRFQLQIDEIELDVSQAIPLGLIFNEAITNSIKYAFPSQDKNDIIITMKTLRDNYIELIISDNGNGLPDGFQTNGSDTLGLKLMKGLTEDIGGTLQIESKGGTQISVIFQRTALPKTSQNLALSKTA